MLRTIPVNRVNPYDELGTIHNNALDFFAGNAPAEYSLDDVLRLSATSVLNDMKNIHGWNDEDLINLQGTAGCAFNTMFLPDNPSDENFIPINIDAIIRAGNLNGIQSDFLRQLLNPSTQLTLAQYGDVVVTIEADILRSSLSCEEQFPLLAATAVGKATVPYWLRQITDQDSPWTPVINPPAAAKPWWKYVLADLGGAAGGAAGGPIGAAGGAAAATIAYAL